MTDVIFRKFKDGGDIIALFPQEPWDIRGLLVSSYQHVGQHGGASLGIIGTSTVLAKPEEYKALHAELVSIGYTDLRVLKRLPRG